MRYIEVQDVIVHTRRTPADEKHYGEANENGMLAVEGEAEFGDVIEGLTFASEDDINWHRLVKVVDA